VGKFIPDLDARHVAVRSACKVPEVFPLGLLLLLWGGVGVNAERAHGNGAILEVLPALCVNAVDLYAEGVEVVRGDLGEDLPPEGVAAALEDLLCYFEVLVVNALLRVDIAADEVGVMPEQGDHRVHAVHKDKRLVVDRDHAVGVEVGGGVVGELPMPLVHVVVEAFRPIDHLLGGRLSLGEDSVSILLPQLRDLARRDAVNLNTQGHWEAGLVLEEGDLVNHCAVELVGGGACVGCVGVDVREELELEAVDGLPEPSVGPSQGKVS